MSTRFFTNRFGRQGTLASFKVGEQACRVAGWMVCLVVVSCWYPAWVQAECKVDTGGANVATVLVVHVSDACTEAEREARAVSAKDIMRALVAGKGVDLDGVVIHGDVLLDELPAQKVAAVKGLSLEDRRLLEGLNDEDVHVIHGPLVIKHARVKGRLASRLKQGFLLITGPVVLIHSTFSGPVDLSRTVFLGVVDGSNAKFEQESYFVQDRFTQGAMFSETRFGPHARYHRSMFGGPAMFRGADFPGLTEFLEVVFEQDANFSRAAFHMGTGFSGAQCRAKCDFSSTQFDREAFFLFARFDRAVTFASARFHAQTDFSDAVFKEADDLPRATFASPPVLTRTARMTPAMPGRPEAGPFSQHVTIALLVAALGLLVYILKAK